MTLKLIRQIGLLWGGSIFAAGLAFLTQLFLARFLGPGDYGIFASALALATVVAPFAGFGLQGFWLKVFGQEGWSARRWIKGSLKFLLFSSILSFTLFCAWAILGPNDEKTTYTLLLMAPTVVGLASIEITISKLQLEERYLFISLWQMAPHALRLLLIYIFWHLWSAGSPLNAAALAYLLVAFALIAVTVKQAIGMGEATFALKGHGAQGSMQEAELEHNDLTVFVVAKEALPFGLAGIFYLLYFQSSIVLLKYLGGNEAAGVYNVAFNVMNAIYLLPIVLYQKFLLSKMHRWASRDKSKLLKSMKVGSVAMLGAGLIAMLLIWVFAQYAIPMMFGQKYKPAVGLLNILAICVPLRFLSTSVGSVLATNEHMRHRVFLMGICAIVNVFLNIILIPRMGVEGSAVATVVTEATLLFLFIFSVGRRFRRLFGSEASAEVGVA